MSMFAQGFFSWSEWVRSSSVNFVRFKASGTVILSGNDDWVFSFSSSVVQCVGK